MKTIRLHGELGKRFGREFKLDVQTPAEAVRALRVIVPGFHAYLVEHAKSAFKVFVGGSNRSDDAAAPCSDREIIRIAPTVQGANAIGRIVLGAALIYFSGGLAAGLMGTGLMSASATAAGISASLVGVGVSMVLGGVVQLLSPQQSYDSAASESPENKPSYNFNGPVNTTAQGHPVPLCYGRMIVGSAVISAGLETRQQA